MCHREPDGDTFQRPKLHGKLWDFDFRVCHREQNRVASERPNRFRIESLGLMFSYAEGSKVRMHCAFPAACTKIYIQLQHLKTKLSFFCA